MLTLMPMAVGIQLMSLIAAQLGDAGVWVARLPLLSVIVGAIGLAASVAHLGQPLRAWRIFLGWRKSWLSREAMVFGAWFAAASFTLLIPAVLPAAAAIGVVGLFCSVMIYVDTRRVFWRLGQTGPRFFGSALLLGAATTFALGIAPFLSAIVIALATLVKLGCDARVMRTLDVSDEDDVPTPEVMSARLLTGPLRGVFGSRIAGALIAGLLLPALAFSDALGSAGSWLVFAAVLIADLTERHLFFRAVDAPKMPGLPGVTGGRA
jgi:DMSO reductase anchor subunit